MILFAKKKQRHRHREQIYECQSGREDEWEIRTDTYSLLILFIEQISNMNHGVAQGTLLNTVW